MKILYARFKDVCPDYFYPGVIDHFPEEAIVSYCAKQNAVYVVASYDNERIRVYTEGRPVYETEIILEKGNLAQRLCSPFDAAGEPRDELMLPTALAEWKPEIADEVFIDGQPSVIVGMEFPWHSKCDARDILTQPFDPKKGYRGPLMFSRNSYVPLPSHVCQHEFGISIWAFSLPAPIYGEGWGAPDDCMFDIDAAIRYDMKTRDEWYERILPLFGRDKVDMVYEDTHHLSHGQRKRIGFYRHHCGFRGRMGVTCLSAKGTTRLADGETYAMDSVRPNDCRKVAIEVGGRYRAYNKERFGLPTM